MDGLIIALYVKFPTNCYLNGFTQYENPSWEMGLAISKDKKWMQMYLVLCKELEEQLNVPLESVVKNDAYINPKLINWEEQFKTSFHGVMSRPWRSRYFVW